MTAASSIKDLVGRSVSLQRVAGHVPYTLRWFPQYGRRTREIHAWDRLSPGEQRDEILVRMRRLVDDAYHKHPFYVRFYREKGFEPSCLRGFDDIQRIPLVTKRDLSEVPLEERVLNPEGYTTANTGGTSGKPLTFLLSRDSEAIEWAHMQYMWHRLGYRTHMTKLSFRGADMGDQPLAFGVAQNEYTVNLYMNQHEVTDALAALLERRTIRFLHGYPSAISEFAAFCASRRPDLAERLRNTLRGALLGSEFPAEHQRERIEETFGIPTLSWYGHSERALLAMEEERYTYRPLQSYGYCEAVEDADGKRHLVGTSFFNLATPFIRYDTEDLVEPVAESDGLLTRFKIAEGRNSDFVVDRAGHKVSLTGLIFGRHHDAFGLAQFIQIRQAEPGKATFLITPLGEGPRDEKQWLDAFNLKHVNIDFGVELLEAPRRSPQGKVPLLVKDSS